MLEDVKWCLPASLVLGDKVKKNPSISEPLAAMYITDKFEDFVEVKCLRIKLHPKFVSQTRLVPKVEVETRVKSLFRCLFLFS